MNIAKLERLIAQLEIIREDLTEDLEGTSDETERELFSDIITSLSEALDDLDAYTAEAAR